MNRLFTSSHHTRCLLAVWTVFFAFPFLAAAQQIWDNANRFSHAKSLYDQKVYPAARVAFEGIKSSDYLPDATYYLASSALKAEEADGAALMEKFVQEYPHHLLARTAYLEMADHYFGHGQYAEALNCYNQSDVSFLYDKLFKKGYAQFELGEYDEALHTFSELEESFTPYEKDAAYFQGYIHHQRGDSAADAFLRQAFDSEAYREPAQEVYAYRLYENKKYEELMTMAEDLAPIKSGAVLNYLADAEYALGKYKAALAHYQELLAEYVDYRKVKNYFQAGYSAYQNKQPEEAIAYLKQAAMAEDRVGAYASYYLGILYAQRNALPFSVTAFEHAAKYKTEFKEDALFYAAKGWVALPNYQRAIEGLNAYATAYPKGRHTEAVKALLGIAYAHTNDYDLAMRYIEQLHRMTAELRGTYQRVSFLKGVALFNDKKFSLAVEVFQKSLVYNETPALTQQAYYWAGEALSWLNEPKDALFYYKSVSRKPDDIVYIKSLYGQAYSYYNTKNYAQALVHFEQFEKAFIPPLNQKYFTDALLRMGDCSFALNDYAKGVAYYKKAEQQGSQALDYIYFQLGLLSRYLGESGQARYYFDRLIAEMPDSPKQGQAYFQKAQMDFESGKMEQAVTAYGHYITQYPSGKYLPYALLNQAVAYENLNAEARAVANYKAILLQFPRHTTANSALLGLQKQQAEGHFDDFDAYLERYKKANPDSQALENIEYENARTNYYAQNYDWAIHGFKRFIQAYPQSALVPEAKYFIADASFRSDRLPEALDYFKQIEAWKGFAKRDKVLHRIAVIEAQVGHLLKSNQYYHQLFKSSSSIKSQINAVYGLMENYDVLGRYDSTIYYGNALLDQPRAGALKSANAQLAVGKAYDKQEQWAEALSLLEPLTRETPNEKGAEAYYYISSIYYKQKDYKKALQTLFTLTNDFKRYERWIGKGYLLMAEIYMKTDEVFQAKATLNSLVENMPVEEIKQQAQATLDTLMSRQ